MKTLIFILALSASTIVSAESLEQIKLDYMLQQQQIAVAMQSRQIAVLNEQLTALKQAQAQAPARYLRQPQALENEPPPSAEPTYSGDTSLLEPSPAPEEMVVPGATPTQYRPQYNQSYQKVVYMPNVVANQQPRYRYVAIPTAVWPQRYVRVRY